jgi:leukotriene-A4 hydrolase
MQKVEDPCSLSNAHDIVSEHVHLSVQAHFDQKILRGYALHTARAKHSTQVLVLDTRGLHIHACSLVSTAGDETSLQYQLIASPVEVFGAALSISLPNAVTAGEQVQVKVEYSTSPTADAIQWLEPQQTRGKRFPYLFTQCQAIHARSLYPCQDTPGAKFTYTAEITVPKDLSVVMSALRSNDEQPRKSADGTLVTYGFTQKVCIPSYLLAIAVGNLSCKKFGKNSRCSVWSEPEMVIFSKNLIVC